MKTFFLTILVLSAMASVAVSSPFIVCDPVEPATIDVYSVTMNAGSPTDVTPQVMIDGKKRLYYDVGTIGVGTHNFKVKAVKIDPVWGRLESAEIPFAFTRPAHPGNPVSIGLVK
jgi:hypothetical protein